MWTNKNYIPLVVLSILVFMVNKSWASTYTADTLKVPVETITDKIRGGLLGQILGNLNGLEHEFEYFDKPGNVKNYTPSLPTGAWTDDDTDFEWVYVMEMQKSRNVFLTSDKIASLWKERINKRIWFSNRYARYLMDINIKPPFTGRVPLNPWAEFNISGMFISETFGLIAPAMPQTAAKIGLNYTSTTISQEPAQATQFFTTMIATAFKEDEISKILSAGIAALDPKSQTYKLVNDIKKWQKQYPDNWRKLRRLLKEKYRQADGSLRNINGIELNAGSTVAALLYGKGDFAETLKIAFNFGWDADNTAAAAGTIVGVIYGYRNMLNEGWMIVDRYRNTTRDNMPDNETITSFADRIIELFEMVNRENGGQKKIIDKNTVYEIQQEDPAPVVNVSSPENQKKQLRDKFAEEIKNNLLNGNREQRARAAYMAVSLDIYKNLSEKYPEQWKKATYNLSGYWKIMDSLFFGGDYNGLNNLKEKFIKAGLKTPARSYSNSELWNDSDIWKNPRKLY